MNKQIKSIDDNDKYKQNNNNLKQFELNVQFDTKWKFTNTIATTCNFYLNKCSTTE